MQRSRPVRPERALLPFAFRPERALPLALTAVMLQLVACSSDPAASVETSWTPTATDAGAPAEVGLVAPAPSALRTPAPIIARSTAPSGTITACPMDVPEGICDRCPDSRCRQVRLSLQTAPSETDWAMFCEEGDVAEEAKIACLCAGRSTTVCARAGADAAQGLYLLETRFGGRVPAVGTRYRDSDGLRATVDAFLHDWLEGIAGPRRTLRCEAPDREEAQTVYLLSAQRVRMTGECQ